MSTSWLLLLQVCFFMLLLRVELVNSQQCVTEEGTIVDWYLLFSICSGDDGCGWFYIDSVSELILVRTPKSM